MFGSSPLPRGRALGRPIELVASDGFTLAATLFEPLGPARANVVVNGAMAVPAGYYRRFAEHLAGTGLRVLTYDYRGVGGSRPLNLRGFHATLSDWADLDARAALDWVSAHHPEPIVHVGHSFGGQLLGLIDADVAGAFLVGSQLGYYGDWALPARLRLALVWRALVPGLSKSFGYLPGRFGLGEDLPAGVAEEWARWCLHPDYLLGHREDAAERLARFSRPTLVMSFTDDTFAPERTVERLISALRSAPVAHRRVSPAELGVASIGHFAFFQPRFADTLWREARWFIDDVVQGRERFRAPPVRNAWGISEEDVALDLAFGRA